jgi:hypothetical protein
MNLKHPLNAVLVDEWERQKPIVFAAERLCLALTVSPNCVIRVEPNTNLRW